MAKPNLLQNGKWQLIGNTQSECNFCHKELTLPFFYCKESDMVYCSVCHSEYVINGNLEGTDLGHYKNKCTFELRNVRKNELHTHYCISED